jgi:hypothetical protein
MSRKLLSTTALTPLVLALGVGTSAAQDGFAAGLPAVAYPNFTLGGFGGSAFDATLGAAEGRLTLPLDHSWGAQVDTILGFVDGRFYGQAAGHLFWRDPTVGLAGLYAAYNHQDGEIDTDTGRVGGEGELYLGNFTASGVAGWKFGDDDGFFAQAKLSVYFDPNSKFYVGYIHEDQDIASIGFEHLFQSSGISLYGEGRIGDDDYKAVFAGIRVYFGNQTPGGKSLIGRDREDVAPLWVHLTEPRKAEASSTTEEPSTSPTEPPTSPTEPPTSPTEPPTTGA